MLRDRLARQNEPSSERKRVERREQSTSSARSRFGSIPGAGLFLFCHHWQQSAGISLAGESLGRAEVEELEVLGRRGRVCDI